MRDCSELSFLGSERLERACTIIYTFELHNELTSHACVVFHIVQNLTVT